MSTNTITAIAGALLLTLTAFAMPAASETQPDQKIDPDTSTPNCLQFYFEYEVGPVTVAGGCTDNGGITIDDDWSPTDTTSSGADVTPDEFALTLDDSSPSDKPVHCLLFDDSKNAFVCLFGAPW